MVESLIPEDDKKRIEPIFTQGAVKVCVGSMRHGGIETFCLLSY